jgi:hypothetical protein
MSTNSLFRGVRKSSYQTQRRKHANLNIFSLHMTILPRYYISQYSFRHKILFIIINIFCWSSLPIFGPRSLLPPSQGRLIHFFLLSRIIFSPWEWYSLHGSVFHGSDQMKMLSLHHKHPNSPVLKRNTVWHIHKMAGKICFNLIYKRPTEVR